VSAGPGAMRGLPCAGPRHRKPYPPLHRGFTRMLGYLRGGFGERVQRTTTTRAPPVHGRLLRPALGDSFCAGHPVGRCSSCRSLSSTRTRPVYPKLYSTRQRVASSGKHGKLDLAWLEPPASLGEITVLHVRDAKDPAQHVERTLEWAWSVWEAWAHHREIVRLCSENPPSVQFGE
jgi:Family of unknown function (DUF5946)